MSVLTWNTANEVHSESRHSQIRELEMRKWWVSSGMITEVREKEEKQTNM